jgi:integrase
MPRRRANNEGSIYRDGDRWVAALVTGHDPQGRPVRRRFTGRTRGAVTAKLDDAKRALAQGLDMPDNRTTIEAFATWWEAEVLPGEGLAPRTERWYGQMLRNYVVPHVGQRTMTGPLALTPADVEGMCAKLARKGRGHRTQVAARTTLSKLLRAAEVRGLVARNVARLAKPPRDRGKARKVKALTVHEVRQLLAAVAGTPWRPIVTVGVTTGLRPGELLALHWSDVHLRKDPHVSVRLAISHEGGPTLKAPKRDRSYRTVPLTPQAAAALKAWRRTQAAERLAAGRLWSERWPDLVFTDAEGRPRRVDGYSRVLREARDGVNPHKLRHTYATHLLEAGVPIHHVAELMGDTVATVESTYSHVLRPKHEVVDVARGILGGAT